MNNMLGMTISVLALIGGIACFPISWHQERTRHVWDAETKKKHEEYELRNRRERSKLLTAKESASELYERTGDRRWKQVEKDADKAYNEASRNPYQATSVSEKHPELRLLGFLLVAGSLVGIPVYYKRCEDEEIRKSQIVPSSESMSMGG